MSVLPLETMFVKKEIKVILGSLELKCLSKLALWSVCPSKVIRLLYIELKPPVLIKFELFFSKAWEYFLSKGLLLT